MGHYNFRKDLQESEKSVEKVREYLKSLNYTHITSNDDGRYDLKYRTHEGKVLTAEVKNDLMYKTTNNVAIEFQSRGKPSGISTSQADVWFYVLDDNIYECSTGKIRVYLIQHWDRFKRVTGGDDRTSLIALLPMDEFTTLFTLRGIGIVG
jgi:hypothetical protein